MTSPFNNLSNKFSKTTYSDKWLNNSSTKTIRTNII